MQPSADTPCWLLRPELYQAPQRAGKVSKYLFKYFSQILENLYRVLKPTEHSLETSPLHNNEYGPSIDGTLCQNSILWQLSPKQDSRQNVEPRGLFTYVFDLV